MTRYNRGMNNLEINMALASKTTAGGQAQAGGGGGMADSEQHPRGYPPLSKGDDVAGADKIDHYPTQLFSRSPTTSLQPVISSLETSPKPVTFSPEDDFDNISIDFFPENFKASSDQARRLSSKKLLHKSSFTPQSAQIFADKLSEYFLRASSGVVEEVILSRESEPTVVRKQYDAPLPLLSEFANNLGLTEKDVHDLAEEYPDSIGQALAIAQDVTKTYLIRRGLDGRYNAQFATFVATNETKMKSKTEHIERRVNMNDLLDRIERASQPNEQ